ncbi:MAG: DUF3370 family protein [Candidatus Sericytochromatia bacterium]|nr:DUF3370 family protein [Candidatus Sericytochromatia bacterium]
MSLRINGSNGPQPSQRPQAAPGPEASSQPARAGDSLQLTTGLNGVLPLPGGLDQVPVLNSNHPEIIVGPGIAVSTLPGGGPHLDYAFRGPFEVFTHHQNRSTQNLFQALVLHNPGKEPVTVKVGPSAASFTDAAPYRDHGPAPVPDPWGWRSSGPGDVTASKFLRGERAILPETITLKPGETRVVHTQIIPPKNEATGQFRFSADGPVHGAVVIEDKVPTNANVKARLEAGKLLQRNPDDKIPTPPGAPGQLIFGRVAGVQTGAAWRATATNDEAGKAFRVTEEAQSRSYLIVGKRSNTLGTGQDHAAPLARRYDDTAYAAHGNYGVTYEVDLPLRNDAKTDREIRLHFDSPGTPLPLSRVFRGPIAVDVTDAQGRTKTHIVHVSQKAGEMGEVPLFSLKLKPGEARAVKVRLVYPANSTPPHALRIETGTETPMVQRVFDTFRSWFGQ